MRRLALIPLLLALALSAPVVGDAREEAKRLADLARQLEHFVPGNRMEAVRELEEIASPKAVDLLTKALTAKHQDWEVQIRTLQALERIGDGRAEPAVVQACIEGEIILVRRAARAALAKLKNDGSAKRVQSRIGARDEVTKISGMRALAVVADDSAFKIIRHFTNDRDEVARAAAATALGDLGDERGVAILLKQRRDKSDLVSVATNLALAKFDTADARDALVEAVVRDEDGYLTRRLTRDVANLGAEGVVDAFAAAWPKVKGGLPKRRLCQAIARVKSERATKLLVETLDDRDPAVRADAAQALQSQRSAAAVEPLKALLADPDLTVRVVALRTLRSYLEKEPRSEVLAAAFANDQAEVRRDAVVYAADDGHVDLLRPLAKLAEDDDWSVATAACISIGRLGNEAEVPVLAKLLRQRDWRRRAAAVEGLFLCRHTSAVPVLISMLDDPHVAVWTAAASGLEVLTQTGFDDRRGLKSAWTKWWEENRGTYVLTKRGVAEDRKGGDEGYGKDTYLVEILKTAQILVVDGRWDKVHLSLDDLKIPYTRIRVQQLKEIGINPKQLILFNCEGGGGVDRASTEALEWFVNVGGYVIATDWALQNVVKDVWPGKMVKWEKNTTRNDAVVIEPAAPDDSVLEGVFNRDLPLKWWLEIQAFAIDILDPWRVTVLVDSLEMMRRYSKSPMLARFAFGHGKVMSSVSHFYLQKEGIANLTTERERMIFAADNMGVSFNDIRDLYNRGFFEKAETTKVTKDYSMFRLIVNFVNEKKRRVENE